MQNILKIVFLFLKSLYSNKSHYLQIIYFWIKNHKYENSPAGGNSVYKGPSVISKCQKCMSVMNDSDFMSELLHSWNIPLNKLNVVIV